MFASATKPVMSKVSEVKYENVWTIKNLSVAITNWIYLDELKQEIEIVEGSSVHSKWVLSLRYSEAFKDVSMHCELREIIKNDVSAFLQCQFSADFENNDGRVKRLHGDKNNMQMRDRIELMLGSVDSLKRFCGKAEEIKISFKLKIFNTAGPDVLQLEEKFRAKSVAAAQKNLASALIGDIEACDVKLICGDGKELMCHKEMLKASSPVFKAMMESGLSEAQTGQIDIADISGETMDILVHYMYTGRLKETWRDPKIILEFPYAPVKYQMTALIEYLDNTLGTIYHADWDSTTLGALGNLARKLSLKKAEAQLKKRVVQRTLTSNNYSDVMSALK